MFPDTNSIFEFMNYNLAQCNTLKGFAVVALGAGMMVANVTQL